MDNLTIAIIAAIVGSIATFLLTKSSITGKALPRTQPMRWMAQTTSNLVDRYRVKRTRHLVRNWFSHRRVIRHLDISEYESARRTRKPRGLQPQLFSGMGLEKPRFAPKLDDHYIAAAIEDLCKKGILLKLPEAQIGSSYVSYASQPAEPKTWTISYFGGKPSEAKQKEERAELERKCIECHHWLRVKGCPGTRYSFLQTEEVDGNTTRYGTQAVRNDQAGNCERCWEDPERL